MPIDYKKYHPKWSLISRLIRTKRAKNRCEWCDVENHSIIDKETRQQASIQQLLEYESIIQMPNLKIAKSKVLKKLGLTKIVLTVAHLDHDKKNNRFDNLKALCQKCHLNYDLKHHVENRKYGRDWKRDQTILDL